jgi:amidase
MPDAQHDRLEFLGLREAAARVASRSVASEALTRALLDRIRNLDGLGAYVQVMGDQALASARRADAELARGIYRGPLHGIPLAVKDIFCIDGEPAAAGMPMLAGVVADRDATVIHRLREAGAVLLGRLTLTEGAYAEHRPPYPAPINPWNASSWSGASSSGSAVAVAAGLAFATLASETGGSTKLPSAANGVTAIKPTWGRVSRDGMFELAASLDHVGIMARCAADLAVVLGCVAGPDPKDPTSVQRTVPDYIALLDRPLDGLRIGLDRSWTHEGVDQAVSGALEGAMGVLAELGAQVVDVRLPDATAVIHDWFGICAVQAALAHESTFPARQSEYGSALYELLSLGHRLSGIDVQRLLRRRELFRGSLNAVFEQVDVLALPVMSVPVPTTGRMDQIDDELIVAIHRFTCPFTMSGHPGIVMPCGFTSQQTPIAFQLVGRCFAEETLLSAGHAFQRATDWHRVHPRQPIDANKVVRRSQAQ